MYIVLCIHQVTSKKIRRKNFGRFIEIKLFFFSFDHEEYCAIFCSYFKIFESGKFLCILFPIKKNIYKKLTKFSFKAFLKIFTWSAYLENQIEKVRIRWELSNLFHISMFDLFFWLDW